MTANGWLQIAIFFLLILALRQAARIVYRECHGGKANMADPRFLGGWNAPSTGSAESASMRRASPRNSTGRATPAPFSPSACFSAVLLYAMQRLQRWLPV